MPVKPPEELKEDEKTKDAAPLEKSGFDIKHVIRGISPIGIFDEEKNIYPAPVVEDYLRAKYLDDGYKLAFVQHLDTRMDEGKPVAEMIFYVFIKQ